MLNINKKAFTLVELIVVITILAILGTIGFISLQGYSSEARDSKRVTDLGQIRTGIQVYQAKEGVVPEPNDAITVGSGSTIYTIQGYAGTGTLRSIKVNTDAKDPLEDNYYTYTTNGSKTKFQLLALLENDNTAYNNVIPTTYADYENRDSYTIGDQLGTLLEPVTNIPVQELGNNIDLSVNTTEYVPVFSREDNTTKYSGLPLAQEMENRIGSATCSTSGNCELLQYTIQLNNDGGVGGSTSTIATYNQDMPSISVPTKDSCTFSGYFSNTDGGGTKYYNSDGSSAKTYTLTNDTILYANWTDCLNAIVWSSNHANTNKNMIWVENTLSKTLNNISDYKAACEDYGYKGLATSAFSYDSGYGTNPRNGDYAVNCHNCFTITDTNQIWTNDTYTLISDFVPSGITVAGGVLNHNDSYGNQYSDYKSSTSWYACKLNTSFNKGYTTPQASHPSFCSSVITQSPDYLICQDN